MSNENYSQGWAADLTGFQSPMPPWVHVLDWENRGLWLHTPLATLEAACHGLKVSSATGANALMCLIPEKRPGASYYSEVMHWEDKGLPGRYFSDDVKLHCKRGYITRSPAGLTMISGEFLLTNSSKSDPWSCTVPSRLVLTGPPGSATMGGGPELVPAFTVRVEMTGSYSVSHASSRPHGLDLDDLEASVTSWLLLQSPTSSLPTTPRGSSLKAMSSSFFSKKW